MIAGTLPRKFAICVSLTTILGLAAFAGNAPAQATPGTFSPPPETISFPDQSPCTGLSGTTTNTVTDFFRFVNNADGTVHIEVYETQDYRSDWALAHCRIAHTKTIGGLSDRQRAALTHRVGP